MREFGFVPDERASALKSNRIKKIGLLVSDLENPLYGRTARLVDDFLKARGCVLSIGCPYGGVLDEARLLDAMRRERVAGILLSTVETPSDASLRAAFQAALDSGVALLFLGKPSMGLPLDTVSIDNKAGTSLVVSRLVESGRRRIAFLRGPSSMPLELREEGFKETLARHSIDQAACPVVRLDSQSVEAGERAMLRLFEEGVQLDAVFGANDLIATGVLKAADAKGVAVPEELAVAGFDDLFFSSLLKPALTTVRQPMERVVSLACERLLARIAGSWDGPKDILVEPELVVRASA
jgi:LacI family transcriptional regulator